jgi:hypothetical protein
MEGVETMRRPAYPRATVISAVLLVAACTVASSQGLPVHEGTRVLRSGSLEAEVGDPADEDCRWNRGTRFSPVANVLRVQLHQQEFAYAPENGGVVDGGFVGGLPMEFDIGQESFQPDPPGYNEGRNGDPFLKVGVGILQRDGGSYAFNRAYPVIERAQTTVTWQDDRAHFVQTLSGTANGYACRLEEDLIVKNDRLVMRYRLENTGSKTFTTEQYIHNFLAFSGRPVGPDVKLTFPYEFVASPKVTPWTPPGPARSPRIAAAPDVVRIANAILYTRTISSVPKTWIYKPEGYVGPDLFAVEHLATEQKVVIGSSIPAANVGIWTTPYQVSPEQFIVITLEPGQVAEFTRTYVLAIDGFVAEDATGDGTVDVNDLSSMSSAWLSEPGGDSWQPSCDVSTTKDDAIDLRDLGALACQWRQPAGRSAPVAHWRLDETAGSAAADERGRHNGTLYNFATDDAQWIEGMDGGALLFDGVDDYVEVSDYAGVTGTRPRTVTAWIKLSERPYRDQVIAAWGEPTAGSYWLLAVATGGKLRLDCLDGYALSGAAGVNDTKWHHVAVVLDPVIAGSPRVSDVKLYIDGQRQAVFEITERDIDTKATEHLRLGAGHSPTESRHFNGIIDDVRLFDSALSAANIRRIYAVPLLN